MAWALQAFGRRALAIKSFRSLLASCTLRWSSTSLAAYRVHSSGIVPDYNDVGACAQLQAKPNGLLCQKSLPMMRQLLHALFLLTVFYGSEARALLGLTA